MTNVIFCAGCVACKNSNYCTSSHSDGYFSYSRDHKYKTKNQCGFGTRQTRPAPLTEFDDDLISLDY